MVYAVQIFEIKDLSADIYDPQKIFGVDNAIKTLADYNNGAKVQQRWHNNFVNMLAFTRRTLEVASLEAIAATEQFKTESIEDWERTTNLAIEAEKALRQFAKHIAVGPKKHWPKSTEGKPIPLRTLIAHPIHHMRFKEAIKSDRKISGPGYLAMGTKDAQTIDEAIELLHWIGEYSSQARTEIASTYSNPGSPQKRVFSKAMMEGWIFLTGKKPSASNEKFCDFTITAWSDVCAIETDWTQAIRQAGKCFSENDVLSLATDGPYWK